MDFSIELAMDLQWNIGRTDSTSFYDNGVVYAAVFGHVHVVLSVWCVKHCLPADQVLLALAV